MVRMLSLTMEVAINNKIIRNAETKVNRCFYFQTGDFIQLCKHFKYIIYKLRFYELAIREFKDFFFWQ